MINEKIVMKNNLFVFACLSVLSGFFLGIGLTMLSWMLIADSSTPKVFTGAIVFLACTIMSAFFAESAYKQLQKYILSPYVKMEDEDDQQNTQSDAVLDSSDD